MKLKYYSELDGVRGVAALLVMVLHFFQQYSYPGSTASILNKLSVIGQTGVDLFFVLSGFLITRILVETKNSEGFFSNFYMRRSLRIFPLYYFALVLSYYVIPFFKGLPIPQFSQQVYYWIYLQNFSTTFDWDAVGPAHFWSLGVEEHFYLFWPLVVYLLTLRKLAICVFVLIVTSFIARIIMILQGIDVYYFTLTRFDSLAIGAFLTLLELKGVLNIENSKKFLLAMLVSSVPIIMLWVSFGGGGVNFIQITKPLMIAAFCFLLLGYIVSSSENNLLKKILNTKLLSYTGKISYGLYVYHPFLFVLISGSIKTGSFLLDFSLNFLLCYVVATLSFYLFENKVLKFKRFFEYRKSIESIEKPVLMNAS